MSNQGERNLFGRRRRANAPGGDTARRQRRYTVTVTPEEDAQLQARAVVRGVTVPRLLFESAMSERVITDTDWKAVAADLFNLRSKMGYASNNLNQLAKFANAESRFPEEAETAIAEYKALIPRVRAAVERLASS